MHKVTIYRYRTQNFKSLFLNFKEPVPKLQGARSETSKSLFQNFKEPLIQCVSTVCPWQSLCTGVWGYVSSFFFTFILFAIFLLTNYNSFLSVLYLLLTHFSSLFPHMDYNNPTLPFPPNPSISHTC